VGAVSKLDYPVILAYTCPHCKKGVSVPDNVAAIVNAAIRWYKDGYATNYQKVNDDLIKAVKEYLEK
jgi:uncharacterized protein YbbK (DUF523 family)